jgi:membrane protease YdiL (CAAX protease family)
MPRIEGEEDSGSPAAGIGWAALFLLCGLLVFFVGLTFAGLLPPAPRLAAQLAVIAGSLVASLALRRSPRPRNYWRLAFAYVLASSALFISEYTGDWALLAVGRGLDSLEGFTALKLGEDAAIVGTIVLLAWLTRDDLAELYLCKGYTRLGLAIGLSSFVVLSLLGVAFSAAQGIAPAALARVLPAFLLIVVADGFMEELLFRGLFLRRMARVIGESRANLVTAAVFALTHLQVEFTPNLPVFIAVVFGLGLLWGWIMQRTRSIIAPALFHAGADMLIISDAARAFGVGL